MSEPKIRYGRGAQTIRYIPVDRFGRPVRITSATFTIIDLDEGEGSAEQVIASGSATLGAVDTTLAAAAGAGQSNARTATLASGTGVTEGHAYLATSGGTRTLCVVDSVSGAAVVAKDPLPTLASGATFQSIELEATFPADEANDAQAITEGRTYQIAWVFSLHGETHVRCQLVHLVRYDGEAWITETDAIEAFPPIANRCRGAGLSIQRAIALATHDFIATLEAGGVVAENYRTSTPGQMAIVFRTVEYLLRWLNTDNDRATADLFQARYDGLVNNLQVGKPGKAVKIEPVDERRTDPRTNAIFEEP